MKKTITFSIALLSAPLLITNCGNNFQTKEESKTIVETPKIEPQAVEVTNPIVNYTEFKIGNKDKTIFKMVDGGKTEVSIGENDQINISAEFEVVKTFKGKAKYDQVFISLVALDKDGSPIQLSTTTNGEMRTNDSDGKEFYDFILGEAGSKIKMIFKGCINKEGSFDSDIEKTKDAAKKIVSFKVLTDR